MTLHLSIGDPQSSKFRFTRFVNRYYSRESATIALSMKFYTRFKSLQTHMTYKMLYQMWRESITIMLYHILMIHMIYYDINIIPSTISQKPLNVFYLDPYHGYKIYLFIPAPSFGMKKTTYLIFEGRTVWFVKLHSMLHKRPLLLSHIV